MPLCVCNIGLNLLSCLRLPGRKNHVIRKVHVMLEVGFSFRIVNSVSDTYFEFIEIARPVRGNNADDISHCHLIL